MKKISIFAIMILTSIAGYAQDTYENARILGNDLNGTARYVGMGGALEALGADISTISTNPAGIGLFRRSSTSFSFGIVSQEDAHRFDNVGKTNFSFDQIGFVYSMETGYNSYVNFAFNYHKSKNFDQILSAANSLRGASLAKHVFGKSTLNDESYGGYTLDTNNNGVWIGWVDSQSDNRAYTYTELDQMYTNGVTMDAENLDAEGKKAPINTYMEASGYQFNRAHSGWISDFDFNLSGNINNRFYYGLTVGIHHVNYTGYSTYNENIIDVNGTYRGDHCLADERKITGDGADLKFGIIVRPFEESPFRLGLSISTPTWYELKSENHSILYNQTDRTYYNYGYNEYRSSEAYKFSYYTPWKFGLSAGHTIDNFLALGLSYEYSDYSSADTRVIDGYDEYDYAESHSDRVMNRNTEQSLKGVHTLKIGAELKPDQQMAVRFGYNYVSPAYKKNGFRDNMLVSEGNSYSSTADFTNWNDTHRITCGIGYRYEKMNFDIAYQYNVTNGTFYPFQDTSFADPDDGQWLNNFATPADVNFKRHQLLFTIGYTF